MQKMPLPNGRSVFSINKHETLFVYDEIFVQRVYTKHELNLEPNSIIFDIGANIGLFSLYSIIEFNNPKIYCFEPAPHCFEALSKNLAEFSDQVKLFDSAVGHSPGEAEFTFYPGNTIMSGIVADLDRDLHALKTNIKTHYEDKTGVTLEDGVFEMLAGDQLDGSTKFKCPVTTFSNVIDAENISRVALAKIDVECAEGMVLDGIEERHWPLIERLVIEVHDQGADEPRRMRDRLASKGYEVNLSITPSLANSGIYEIFAQRSQ